MFSRLFRSRCSLRVSSFQSSIFVPTYAPSMKVFPRSYCEEKASIPIVEPAEPAVPKRGRYAYWKLGFIDLIRNPQDHIEQFYDPADANLEGRTVCVVKDRMPKAKIHLMVMPTTLIQKYKLLNETHIDLLQEMKERAEKLVQELKQTEKGKDLNFKIGFQAIPSMLQIHLHVISDDFDSPNIKNKRHWNTFNTDFFIQPDLIIGELKEKGYVELDEATYNEIIKQPLACPICSLKIKRIPELMAHIDEVHNKVPEN